MDRRHDQVGMLKTSKAYSAAKRVGNAESRVAVLPGQNRLTTVWRGCHDCCLHKVP